MNNNRVWVYLSERILDEATIAALKVDIQDFLYDWKAHGESMSASAEILHKRFIVIKADEQNVTAGGCSIDKQFQFIKEVEKKYNLSLLNRLIVAYKDGNEVKVIHSAKVPELLASGKLNENTIIFNVAVGNENEFAINFEIPLSKSWLAKFLVKVK